MWPNRSHPLKGSPLEGAVPDGPGANPDEGGPLPVRLVDYVSLCPYAQVTLSLGAPVLAMTQPAYREVVEELTRRPPEAGGMLVGPRDTHLVTHFLLDEAGRASPASFTLDHKGLNRTLRDYLGCRMDVKGFAHSHPPGVHTLSQGDLDYLRPYFSGTRHRGADCILMPLVCDGQLFPYVVRADHPRRPVRADLVLV